jgi:hypothetical protein
MLCKDGPIYYNLLHVHSGMETIQFVTCTQRDGNSSICYMYTTGWKQSNLLHVHNGMETVQFVICTQRDGKSPIQLNYPACNTHAPYCLWPALLYNIFPHYFIKARFYLKKLLNTKCMFWFPPQFYFWNISHSKKKWARYDQKMPSGRREKYPLFLSDFKETWIFSTVVLKILKYQISWKSV